jgi:hypothetical protein
MAKIEIPQLFCLLLGWPMNGLVKSEQQMYEFGDDFKYYSRHNHLNNSAEHYLKEGAQGSNSWV